MENSPQRGAPTPNGPSPGPGTEGGKGADAHVCAGWPVTWTDFGDGARPRLEDIAKL